MAIMAGALVDVADFSDTGWLDDDVTWAANFEDYSPSVASNHFEYRRIGSVVYLRGLVRRITADLSPGSTATMFTLPTGFRPSRNAINVGMSNLTWNTGAASAGTAHTHPIMAGSSVGPTVRIVVNASGSVQVSIGGGQTLAIDNWVSVSAISFPVDL